MPDLYLFQAFKRLRVFLLVLGVISLFTMGGEKEMIDEIAKQHIAGLSISELKILNSFYIINVVFIAAPYISLR